MQGFQVMLDKEQSHKLEEYIYELTSAAVTKAVTKAVTDAGSNKEFLSQKEICDWIGVSTNTLKSYVRMGLPVIVMGGRNLYSKKEVSKFLLERQIGG